MIATHNKSSISIALAAPLSSLKGRPGTGGLLQSQPTNEAGGL